MRYWTQRNFEDGSHLPTAVASIVNDLMDAFTLRGGSLRLIAVGQYDDFEDFSRYEAVVELAPGVRLPVEFGSTEDDDLSDYAQTDADNVVIHVLNAVDACLPETGRFSDLLHQARVRARKILSSWSADGLHTGLVDVQLAPFDHWQPGNPGIVVKFEGLGATLNSCVDEITIDPDGDLDEALETARQTLRTQYDRRTELAMLGATGTIDRLALNAIRHFGNVDATLLRLATESRFWLPDDTAILNCNGHVVAGSGRANPPVIWNGDTMQVMSAYVPLRTLKNAVGRPVMEFVEHDFLTPDILVANASCSIRVGKPSLEIGLVMPRLAFCAVSGRIWELDATQVTSARPSNVVTLLTKRP